MKTILALIVFFCCFSAYAQKDSRIVIGKADTVYSKILNEKRTILVHVPDGDKTERYPVLYILDGENHFQSAVAIVEQISGIIPNMVIIGIVNTNRERDLTPTHVAPDRLVNESEAKRSGGGEKFLSFIETELIPYVDSHYPTTPYRTFSGHSLGGLAVMNAFINHTSLFNAYIAIDPSLWWEGERWIKTYQAGFPQRNFNNKALFVGVANNIPAGMDTVSIVSDTTEAAPVTHAVLPFVHQMQRQKLNGLRWGYKFYPNEWHGSVELNAEYDALRYLFKFYHFDMNNVREHPQLNADSLLAAHFEDVSAKLGYKVIPTEDLVNELAYDCMGRHKMDIAYRLFTRNIVNHPGSANVYDSLGDYFVSTGEKQKAIAAFTKSLSLQETGDTRSKLNDLLGKK